MPEFSDIHEPPTDINSLSAAPEEMELGPAPQVKTLPNRFLQMARRLDVILVILLILGSLGAYYTITQVRQRNNATGNAEGFNDIKIPLAEIVSGKELTISGTSNVTINGQLQLQDTLYITPGLQPTGAKPGQIYFDQSTNQLAYFNGSTFVFLTGASASGIQSLGGATGQILLGSGLNVTGNQLSNGGVLSVQGQTGDVTLSAGPGIVINGTTFSNSGVLSVASGSPNVTVGSDGSGNVTISVSGTPGSGTVTSSGGTAGSIPLFTGSQNIENSIITQSGLTVTITGDLSVVTGGLSLSTALTVSNGGTGATSLAANGVLVGQGTAAISSVATGTAGLCLLSTAGTPVWAACPTGNGVASLNGLTGALNIANASAAGTTITIDDASTSAKGIASFNGTNFSASGGNINTIQDINSSATPTFAGVNTNTITPSAALTVGVSAQTALLQGSTTTITSNGAGNNIILNSAATIELQDNTNVTGNLATSGDIAVNGGDITSTGALNITPGGALTIGVASQALTLQGGPTSSFRATSSGNTTVVGFTSPTANTTLNFPALAAGTYTICTTSGNCAGAGVTLQAAYSNSSDPEIVLDATRGALTIRDASTPIGANLLEVQNNTGSATYLAVTTAGAVVTGVATVSGNINSTSGALQTGSTTRIDNSGNAINIGNVTLSGAISGGTSISGSGNINSTGGGIQTNSTTRIDNSGNLINIAGITASGSATFQGGGLTLGTNAQLGSIVLNDGSSNTGTLQVAALGQNTVYTLPDPGSGTATICLTSGNCAGTGGGVTTGGGTTNRLAKFTGAQAIGDSTITDDGTNVTVAVDVIIQGGDLTVGSTSQTASVTLHDGNGQTTTLQAGNSTGNLTFILPTNSGIANQCLKQSGTGNQLVWQDCDGGAGGSSATLQTAYNNSTNPEIVLNSSVGGLTIRDNSTPLGTNLFEIQNNLGNTTYFNVTVSGVGVTGSATVSGNINSSGGALQTNGTTRIDNSGNAVNIGNITGSGAITIASIGAGNDITVDGADQFIVQDASVFNALSTFNANVDLGANDIIGTTGNINLTNFDVVGTTGNVTAGTYNGQTISSSANFTGTVAVAGNTTLTGDIAVNGGDITSSGALAITPGGTLTVGATGQQLILQGSANTVLTATGSGFTTTVGFSGVPTANVTYNFDRAAATGTYTICTSIGNCASAGGGVTTLGGTTGTLAKFTGSQTLGDSLLSESGSIVTINGNLNLTSGNQFRVNGTQISSANLSNDANLAKLSASQTFTGGTVAFQNATNSTNAFNIQNATGNRILTVDSTNAQVILGVSSILDGKLVFDNISNTNTVTILPGTPTANRSLTLPDASGIICTDSGNCAGAGATLQTAYNFSVGGTTPKIKLNSTLLGVDIQDADTTIAADLFDVRASNAAGLGSVMFGVGSTGQVTLQNSSNSTAALRLLTSGGTAVLTGDTTNGQILLGQSGTLAGTLVFKNATNSNTITISAGTAPTANRTITLPNSTGTICLSSGNCSGAGSSNTLQAAYDAGNTITSTDGRDVSIALVDTTTDSNFLIDLQCDVSCGANGRFAIQDDGSDIFNIMPAGGAALFKNSANSTTAFGVQQAGGNMVINVDTTNGELELGKSSALDGKLVFNNAANANTITLAGPTAGSNRTINLPDEAGTVCLQGATSCGFAPSTGGSGYIQNSTTMQSANFFIQNAGGSTADTAVIRQSSGQTGKLLRIQDTSGSTDLLSLTSSALSVNTTLTGDGGVGNSIISNLSPVNALITGNSFKTLLAPGATATGLIVGNSASIDTNNNASYSNANILASLGQVNWATTGSATGTSKLIGSTGKIAAYTGSGAIAKAIGVMAEGQFQGGAVTDYYGLYSTMNPQTNIAVQNAYGLKIDDFAATGGTAPTNFYAIATDGGQVRFRSNSTGGLQVQNSAGTTTILNVDTQNGSVTVNGTETVQAQTDSSSVFKVLNASSGSLFNIDSTNAGVATLFGMLPGEVNPWSTSSNSIPASRYGGSSFTANGYIYHVGGNDGTNTSQTTVYYTKVNTDGTVNSWTTATTTPLPAARVRAATVVASGYVYVMGGLNTSTTTATVYYAHLNTDGTLGTWQTAANALPAARQAGSTIYANGYIYYFGGKDSGGTIQTTVYYAKVGADGSVGAWTTSSNPLTAARYFNASVGANGYVYVVGGTTTGEVQQSTIYYARLNGDGSTTSWTTATNSLPNPRSEAAALVSNGYLYVIGGGDSGGYRSTVYYARLNADGSVGTWSTSANALPANRASAGTVIVDGYMYIIAGFSGSSGTTTVYSTSGSRVQVGASLDLVGLQGQSLADGGTSAGTGSTGGSITAGNGRFVGALDVIGQASFSNSLSVNGALTAFDTATFQNGTDTTKAFQVLNASNVPQFSVDTSNSRVYVGNPTADSTGALLVLDIKNTSGDPTGVAGGMYYNSSSDVFRCYEGGEWRNCVTSAQATGTTGAGPASVTDNTSSTYINMPGSSSLAFNKAASNSTVTVTVSVTLYAITTAPDTAFVGVNIDSTDYDCGKLLINTLSNHNQVSCSVVISGVSAGSKTAQLRLKRTGSGAIRMDSNDWITIAVTETN